MRKAELALALLLTVVAVWLHITRATTAGALWRDEVSAVELALTPSITDIPRLLEHEAFPVLFSLILRSYAAIAGSGDVALRIFGLLVGLCLLAALWLNARVLTGGVPLVALALVGVNAAVIQWVDWTRGHGVGTLLMLLTFALIWRLAVSPSKVIAGLATLAAFACVQTLYYNAVLLFAIGLAGAVVALRRGGWKRALLVLGVCSLAAVSLLPYLSTMRGAGESSEIFVVTDFSLAVFWEKLSGALATAPGMALAWLVLLFLATVNAVVLLLKGDGLPREVSLYCLIAIVVSVPAYFLFLQALKYPTQPWYYVALLCLAAVAMDGVFNVIRASWWSTAARLGIAAGIALWSLPPTHAAIQLRQTNLDLVAQKVEEASSPGDLVVVMPWYLGVTFQRYYSGAAPWTTVPPVEDHKLQRYDLLKAQMAAAEPMTPVLAAVEKTLRSGQSVWLVGQLVFPREGVTVPVPGPAPDPTAGWSEGAYLMGWMHQVMQFLQDHVATAEEIKILVSQPLNPHEHVQVIVVRGWRSD